MTQVRLAALAGVARETVYRTERGRLPTGEVAGRLCDALGLDRDVLDLKRRETDSIAMHPGRTHLRDRRRSRGLTLAACAEKAGVSPATLSRFERGAEQSRALAAFDAGGFPVRMVNAGFAAILGFETLAALDHYWRTGRE